MPELPLPASLVDKALKETRSGLEKGAYKVNRSWLDLEKLSSSERTSKGKKLKLRTRLESAFNPLVSDLFQQYNYSDFGLSLLFFIQIEFGVKFKRSAAGNFDGYLYGLAYDAWIHIEPKRFPTTQRAGRLIQKCLDFTIIDVPEKYQKEIRSCILDHRFKSQPTEIDKAPSSGKSIADRLAQLTPEQRTLTQQQYSNATADFPEESSGLVNFFICPTDECTLEATKRDYQRFEKDLEKRSSHNLVYDRLDQVFQLKPSKRYWGKNAYEGYTALEFHGRAKILLTSPIYGNAIYILDKREWRYLTNTYRKEEIRFKFPEKSTTFPHEGAWLHKVHRELQRASFG